MNPYSFFTSNKCVPKKKYDALKDFFFLKKKANIVAGLYGYTISSLYSLIRDFKKCLEQGNAESFFFKEEHRGRKSLEKSDNELQELIISFRKKNFSVPDIVAFVNAKNYNVSISYVGNLLRNEGFSRLQRRSAQDKRLLEITKIEAPKAEMLKFVSESFHSTNAALLCFLPYISKYGIDKLIENSDYPQTRQINKQASVLSVLALKLSNIRRYSCDDIWCMDRGIGLFAGLNVLPKTAWFTSYSYGVTREMNLSFLKGLHEIWQKHNLLSDTTNLDFTTIPCWGDGEHLENNWSGKRGKSLSSMLAVLAQDPDTGIIDYGDTTVLHKEQDAVILEFLDFYQSGSNKDGLKYLIFDSKFTTYQNLSKLDIKKIKFITIRRRGKKILDEINAIEEKQWKKLRVECADNKNRNLKINEQIIFLKGYGKDIRQIAIKGNGKIKPALVITNDFSIELKEVVRKYARRWIVEKCISEQISFFHLNRVSSSMVIKVDFDLTMSILAHNIYRLFAMDLGRYSNYTSTRIYEKIIANNGSISVDDNQITVALNKKRDISLVMQIMEKYKLQKYDWLSGKKLLFNATSTT